MACLAALTISAPVPEADPDAFVNLGAVAIPAITGSALIDGLLLGKVAFLKGKLLPRLKVSTQFRGNILQYSEKTPFGFAMFRAYLHFLTPLRIYENTVINRCLKWCLNLKFGS